MKERVVFLNGEFLSADRAHISPFDRGFLLGDGIFETLRVKEGKALFLKAHLARLRKSAQTLKITYSFSLQTATSIVQKLVSKNKIREGRLRITLTRGVSSAPGIAPCANPTFLIMVEPYTEPNKTKYQYGCKVIIFKSPVFSNDILSGIKTTSRLRYLLAQEEAKKRGADEALFINEKDQITECTNSNIFIAKENSLSTPPLSSGILNGTVRNLAIKLARESEITVQERPISVKELFCSDEVFLTNSLFGILPVSQIDDVKIRQKTNKSLTKTIYKSYKNAVLRELKDC